MLFDVTIHFCRKEKIVHPDWILDRYFFIFTISVNKV